VVIENDIKQYVVAYFKDYTRLRPGTVRKTT